MDEADKKMEALKKAYADIIFNTTKEATAKIMVVERRAYQCHKEMYEAKEEALNMLVRFKTMMDDKITQAEMISFNQRIKIEELEVQLQKAEHVANGLRAELKEVKEELEELKNNRVQPLDKHNVKRGAASNKDGSQEIECSPLDSGPGPLSSSHLHQRHTTFDHCSSESENVSMRTGLQSNSPEEQYAGNPDIPSIKRGSKGPQVFRSSCPQRIRAFRRKRIDGKSAPPVHKDSQSSSKKNKVDNMCLMKKNNSTLLGQLHKSNNWDKGQDLMFSRVPCRKRGIRSRRSRITLCTDQKLPVENTLSRCQTYPCVDKDSSMEIDEAEHNASVSPLTPVNTANTDTSLGPVVDVQIDAKVTKANSIENAVNGGTVLKDRSNRTTQEDHVVNTSEFPELLLNLNKVKVPVKNSDTKDDENCEMKNLAITQTLDDKFLKYQRKRKRVSLSSPDGSTSLEDNITKKRPNEMQRNVPEPQKSSLPLESSRDDRRLMLVARQLISLKENRR
ncbi:hypothetical protein FRX31_022254 [Thalictrum thalictroides]|uniref:Uncharacterized protein n=1 Tax=Thalictrum thalictroides TaxID=46969 RepID=A0A7J6VU96_THATH|nr:hypothetical protein FRX31_022254 [Thalictrum thalictroides]